MFLVIYRKPGKGPLYDDDVVLMTEDLVKAVNKAIDYKPFGWSDPHGWSHHADRVSVFRHVAEKDEFGDLVYARWTKKHGHSRGHTMRWIEAWGLPMWKKAYDRRVRETAYKIARLERDFARIIREHREIEKGIFRVEMSKHSTSKAAK